MSPRPDALVIASHLPGEGHFRSERFEVVGVECENDHSYWAGLARFWQSDRTIINVEHDVEGADEHVAALLDCPHPLATFAYRMHWVSGREGWAQRGMDADGMWADRSGIGLCKIAPEARVGPLRREAWARVELAVEAAVRGPWRVLWPEVNHWHW